MATAIAEPPVIPPAAPVPVLDATEALHRYNACLPSSYRDVLSGERDLQLAALRTLSAAIASAPLADGMPSPPENPDSAEAYERQIERDLAAFEKGVARFLDLKYDIPAPDYHPFVSIILRGALSYSVDMGLRSKLARSVTRISRKRNCLLPDGIAFRPILDIIQRVHLDCVDGGPFIGKDIRDSHCRNLLALLHQARDFPAAGVTSDAIYAEFGSLIDAATPQDAFEPLLLLGHIIPTRGGASLAWLPDALHKFTTLPNAPEWDATWMGIFCRAAKHQPGAFDWSPSLPYIFSRIVAAFRLPLGSAAPQHPIERRCPHHCQFLIADRLITASAVMVAYALSPTSDVAISQLRRLVALVANFFHPSNGGRWTGNLGSFLHQFSVSFSSRVVNERAATKAGEMGRVLSTPHDHGIAPAEERLSVETVDEIAALLLPLIQQGLHSKSNSMTIQAASASRDLAVIAPHIVVDPLLGIAAECLESVSSPHRTSAALKMLSALTPVFLDPQFCPDGAASLPQALTLTLPGIDPNDPGKTESTLRFIAGAAARIQSMLAAGENPELTFFVDDYTHQLLERIFPLLDTLEAPPKKGRNGNLPSNTSPQLSSFIFAVSMDNLFAAVPAPVARAAAERVARQITGAASLNAKKCYGALVRSVASAVAASSEDGSSASIFIPRLMDQILADSSPDLATDELELAPLADDELVWRLRMLAQVCRACGEGLDKYSERIVKIISLAFGRSERPVYKAGGRLLRGILEGLTAVKTALDSIGDAKEGENGLGRSSAGGGVDDDGEDDDDDGVAWNIKWRLPSDASWKLGEDIVSSFISEAHALVKGSDGKVCLDRDVLFRVLRMLHATQRGARWIMAGVTPARFAELDKFDVGVSFESMTKSEAILALRKPAAAGLGGERNDPAAAALASDLWGKAYSLTLEIMCTVMANRPDDGALLYRCLEPLELAHEPFRRSNQGRLSSHACSGYKAAYYPVIAAKRPFDAEGGVGRSMPRFIFKLRIEAQHEYRLGLASRGGVDNVDLFNRIMTQVTELSLNAFPFVRGEARGILTRGWRVAHPTARRENLERVVDALSNAAAETQAAQREKATRDVTGSSPTATADTSDGSSLQYEIMMGASSLLRSAAAAPNLMREWALFDRICRVLLQAIVVAERPDASAAVGNLFAKLAGLARPLGYLPVRLVGHDLAPVEPLPGNEQSVARLEEFQALNVHLIGMISKPHMLVPAPGADAMDVDSGSGEGSSTQDAHWRLQSLVATVLTICLREDCPPSPDVAKFLTESMVSDVVSLRHISARAVALILAMHGDKKSAPESANGDSAMSGTEESTQNSALVAIEDALKSPDFGRRLVHTLALDHDDGMASEGSSGATARSFGVFNFSRYVDGDACWSMISGRPWPSSWVSRSRDTLNIVQIRMYEVFCRVYGKVAFDVLAPVLSKLVLAIDAKEEQIIEGVRDDNVRVIAGELVAGMARGLSWSAEGVGGDVSDQVMGWADNLLSGFTGPTGAVNGGTLIRLLMSAAEGSVGKHISIRVVSFVVSESPIVVAMDKGSAAHLQARRLRYAHACLADLLPDDNDVAGTIMKVMGDLSSPAAFGHELKNVREEVARLMCMLATFKSAEGASQLYSQAVKEVGARQSVGAEEANAKYSDETEEERETRKKFRARQGETLSRWISVVYWNGDALGFSEYLPILTPAIVASLDEETDPDRVSHARLALSLAAQGALAPSSMLSLVKICEQISKSPRYRVRGALLPFIQVLSFSLLYTADAETLDLMLQIVTTLLSDPQLEVREAAAGTFVPFIRDAPAAAISAIREKFLKGLAKSKKRVRRGTKVVFTPEELASRHGAVAGLGSMVAASPYDVPEWLPSVLVALTDCINDPPPISTATQKIFADFMRTHRDEWQTHKLAFSEDELERVSELMISPSYYA